jgi:hypothetical protein
MIRSHVIANFYSGRVHLSYQIRTQAPASSGMNNNKARKLCAAPPLRMYTCRHDTTALLQTVLAQLQHAAGRVNACNKP